MERKTYKQLADRLRALAIQFAQNSDTFAEADVCAAVATLEQAIVPPKHECERPANINVTDAHLNIRPSMSLSEVVSEIQATTCSGRPLSERFRGEVAQHDRTRCIASIVFEDLWNGFDGWKSPSVFWEMVIFVWRNAPEFFEDYDPDREIIEESARWTQRYFDEQRNFLRHNFCLKRLCHLVMVYEHLHGADATVKKSTPAPFTPPNTNRYVRENTLRPSRPNRGIFVCIAIVVCVVLSVAASICLFGKHDGKKGQEIPSAQPEVLVASAENTYTNQPQACQIACDETTNDVAKISAQAETTKAATRSNEVVKTTIALQEVAPQAPKVPVLRPGNVANAGNDTNEQ